MKTIGAVGVPIGLDKTSVSISQRWTVGTSEGTTLPLKIGGTRLRTLQIPISCLPKTQVSSSVGTLMWVKTDIYTKVRQKSIRQELRWLVKIIIK